MSDDVRERVTAAGPSYGIELPARGGRPTARRRGKCAVPHVLAVVTRMPDDTPPGAWRDNRRPDDR